MTGDPCVTCGRPVDSHTPTEASKCRSNAPQSLIPKPTVEAKPKEEVKTETTSTSSDVDEKPEVNT